MAGEAGTMARRSGIIFGAFFNGRLFLRIMEIMGCLYRADVQLLNCKIAKGFDFLLTP